MYLCGRYDCVCLCVYMHMCVCICVHVCMCMCTCVCVCSVHIFLYVYMYICVCVHMCMCVYKYVCACAEAWIPNEGQRTTFGIIPPVPSTILPNKLRWLASEPRSPHVSACSALELQACAPTPRLFKNVVSGVSNSHPHAFMVSSLLRERFPQP